MDNSYAPRLTTIDNPFDPFDDFANWYMYDVQHGYNTCEKLSLEAKTSSELNEEQNNKEIEKAIDQIIKNDFVKIYKKVFKN